MQVKRCFFSKQLIKLDSDEFIFFSLDELRNYGLNDATEDVYVLPAHAIYITADGPFLIAGETKYYFNHIPKNGGSSIRSALNGRRVNNLSLQQRRLCYELNADINHLTPSFIKTYFPDLLNKIHESNIVSIVRDPLERFVSALAQRLRWYYGKNLSELSRQELLEEVAVIINYIASNKSALVFDKEFIHFQRQSDFLFKKNMGRAEVLYLLDNLNKALIDILTDLRCDYSSVVVKNQTLEPKNVYLNIVKNILREKGVLKFLKKRFPSLVLFINSIMQTNDYSKRYINVLKDSPRFGEIIEYYKEDFELINTLRKK